MGISLRGPEHAAKQNTAGRRHAILVLVPFAGALYLRVALAAEHVFLEGYVRFRGTDAWYHLRLVENLLQNFPQVTQFDPYLKFPSGGPVTLAPLYDAALACFAWIAGFGQPSAQTVEAVAAWFPVVLGALVTVPVYFSAHRLWGQPAGLVAAALVALLPGRFLERSLLGATDHHVAEVLLSSCCLWLLLEALRRVRGAVSQSAGSDPFVRLETLWPSALAGLALAAYLLSWRSGTGLPIVILGWIVLQILADWRCGRSSSYLAPTALPALGVALLVVLPWLDATRVPARHAIALAGALAVGGAAIAVASQLQRRRQPAPWLMGILPAAMGVTILLASSGFGSDLADLFRRLAPSEWGLTVAEMRPLYADDSAWAALWREYGTAAVASGFGLALTLWQAARRGRPETVLLLVWSLAILGVSLAQRRFTYYLAPVIALLSAGAVCWLLSRISMRWSGRHRPLVLTAVMGLLLIPNLGHAIDQARQPSGPDPEWHAALSWLRTHTPEPFGDPDQYFAALPADGAGAPRAAYGVLAWWDRGFWLTRIARRPPIANPQGHGIATAASFYLARSEGTALPILAESGARYVIVDADMPIRQIAGSEIGLGTLASMATWLEQPVAQLVERYELRSPDGSWQPVFFYHPAYFRTMTVRLQTFSGQAARPGSLWVVSYDLHQRADGSFVKRVAQMKRFDSHPQALNYLEGLAGDNHRLVSTDPAASCVPLTAVDGLRRVYPSGPSDPPRSASIQIFELVD